MEQWRIQGGAPLPLLAHIFFQKAAVFRVKAYISLCAFAINEARADKLSSALPLSKFLDPPLAWRPVAPAASLQLASLIHLPTDSLASALLL